MCLEVEDGEEDDSDDGDDGEDKVLVTECSSDDGSVSCVLLKEVEHAPKEKVKSTKKIDGKYFFFIFYSSNNIYGNGMAYYYQARAFSMKINNKLFAPTIYLRYIIDR